LSRRDREGSKRPAENKRQTEEPKSSFLLAAARWAVCTENPNERWNNCFVPERECLTEAYVNGRFEIVLYGNLRVGHLGEIDWP
jgi:hypothetical protein